jgi:uncharacterized protein (TIGR00255 family)
MTGFGAAEGDVGGGTLRVEIKSVNHRYSSLALKAPAEVAQYEQEIRDRLRRDFERGHFTVAIRWLSAPPRSTGPMKVDVEQARAAVARLRELERVVGVGGGITLELVARQPDVFAPEEGGSGPEWVAVAPIVGQAIESLTVARRREGTVVGNELLRRLELVRSHATLVAARAPERLVRERDRLRAAVMQLLDGRAVDEGRLAQELAFLAERLDITEELVRLAAHLDACVAVLSSDKPAGKQLGFLAQELGREVNTIGSKANDATIQHLVVEMKGELERFREQLENLE